MCSEKNGSYMHVINASELDSSALATLAVDDDDVVIMRVFSTINAYPVDALWYPHLGLLGVATDLSRDDDGVEWIGRPGLDLGTALARYHGADVDGNVWVGT